MSDGTIDLNLSPDLGGAWRRSRECRDLVAGAAKAAARQAALLAPDDPHGPAKDLHSSIVGEAVLTEEGWVGRTVVRNFKGAWYEFGTSKQAARPYLRPGAEAAGLRFEDPDL